MIAKLVLNVAIKALKLSNYVINFNNRKSNYPKNQIISVKSKSIDNLIKKLRPSDILSNS